MRNRKRFETRRGRRRTFPKELDKKRRRRWGRGEARSTKCIFVRERRRRRVEEFGFDNRGGLENPEREFFPSEPEQSKTNPSKKRSSLASLSSLILFFFGFAFLFHLFSFVDLHFFLVVEISFGR